MEIICGYISIFGVQAFSPKNELPTNINNSKKVGPTATDFLRMRIIISTCSGCVIIFVLLLNMEIDPLICDDCGEYLSHAPVYLRPISGESLCGVCATEQPEMVRNRYYELVAQHLRFPCKYEQHGCCEVIVFHPEETDEHPHEVDCRYKAYLCPLDKIDECDWQGPVHELYLHFLREHPLALFDNPCVFNHDIDFSNIYICLVPACGELFLVQAEVLLPQGRIYHSVRLFGKSSLAHDYKFELFIQRKSTYISRTGVVLPMDSMEISEDTSITTKVINLMDFMGGFDNTQFIINIQNVDDLQDNETESHCHYCNKWRYLEHGVCSACRLDLKSCSKRSNGCCQMNLFHKIEKHETLYCNYTNWCDFCDGYIYPNSKSKSHHYLTKHTTYKLGSFVHISRTNGQFLTMFFRSEFGIVCCNYYLSNKKLEIQIVTPLLNVDLRHFRCKVFVEGPSTGPIAEFVLEQRVHSFYDWVFLMQKCGFSGWNSSFCVKIEIRRY